MPVIDDPPLCESKTRMHRVKRKETTNADLIPVLLDLGYQFGLRHLFFANSAITIQVRH